MSDEKCPKCGAERAVIGSGNPNVTSAWECGTYRGAGEKLDESSKCLKRQLAAANAIIDKLCEAADNILSLRETGVCQDARDVAFEQLEEVTTAAREAKT